MGKEARDEMSFWRRKQAMESFQHMVITGASAISLGVFLGVVILSASSDLPVAATVFFTPLIVMLLISATDHFAYGVNELRHARSLARGSDDAEADG